MAASAEEIERRVQEFRSFRNLTSTLNTDKSRQIRWSRGKRESSTSTLKVTDSEAYVQGSSPNSLGARSLSLGHRQFAMGSTG